MKTFIDMGCGNGGSITYLEQATGAKCILGVDNDRECIKQVHNKGYPGRVGDIAKVELFPTDFITFVHVLEHLPKGNATLMTIWRAMHYAYDLIIIRQPFFHDSYLKQLGYKLCWSNWECHPNHMSVTDWIDTLYLLKLIHHIDLIKPITSTLDPNIIPLDAPFNSGKLDFYDESLGKKEDIPLREIYTEIRVLIKIPGGDSEFFEHIKKLQV